MSKAESGVKQQLEELRGTVETAVEGRESVEGDADLAQSFADLGLAYLTYEFLEPAEVCLRNARSLQPDDYRWHYLLGYLRMIQGFLPEALDLYRGSLELQGDFLPAILRLGRSELELGRAEEAKPWFDRALDLEPGTAAALEGLGKVASAEGDSEQAVSYFSQALALDPAASGLHYALAQAYRDLGKADLARTHLDQAGDVGTRISDPLINPLANLAESARFYLVQGAEAMDDESYEVAAAAFRAAKEQDEQSFEAHRGLAIALDRLGDRHGALKIFEQALEIDVDLEDPSRRQERVGVLAALATLNEDSGRVDEAFKRWHQVLEIEPRQPQALLQVGNGLAVRGRFAEAVAAYDTLLTAMPEWAVGILEKRATALVNLGRDDQAIADFTRALELSPDDRSLQLRFADALEHLGRGEAAAEQRKAATGSSTATSAPPERLIEARRLIRAGNLEKAAAVLHETLRDQPDFHEARYELASVLGHAGRLGEAAETFAAVREALPRHIGAHQGLVTALILDQRYGDARKALQDALRTFPRHLGFALTQVELLSTAPDPGVRDGKLAIEIARRVQSERQDPVTLQALAFAHAAAGDFKAAVAIQEDLVDEAKANGDPRVVAALDRRLSEFRSGRQWIAKAPEELVALLGGNS